MKENVGHACREAPWRGSVTIPGSRHVASSRMLREDLTYNHINPTVDA